MIYTPLVGADAAVVRTAIMGWLDTPQHGWGKHVGGGQKTVGLDVREAFKDTVLAHVIAFSGFKITFVAVIAAQLPVQFVTSDEIESRFH
ncbi:MAG: hypothetical protein FVQ83_12960 [Chloroflexi bacterium]|nr:hypothetical protein [Chloroflexota bacterium]